jgi:peptidoglycan hydrolase-like protein with peptidoglycan-binding domain
MMNRKHRVTFSEPDPVPNPLALVRRGRIVAMASVLAVAPIITGFPQVSAQPQAHPVKSTVRQVGFVRTSVPAMRTARNATRSTMSAPAELDPIATARSGAVAPVQDVAGAVTVVGVTWPKGAVSAGDQYQIRTMTGATWSQWQPFDADPADGPDPAEAAAGKGGTSPYVVTGASKYEVRSLSTDLAVPAAAKVDIVDPGTSAADNIQPAPGAAVAAAAKPTIYSRAQWGASEGLRRGVPSYGRVQVGFVHHTVSSNSYSSSSVPSMIRGMYAYHVQSLGWSDIGYNFLVDRFGRTWEGRYGRVNRPVVGAQTMNFNSVSMGVSAIGNYDVGGPPQAMTNAIKRILAWKFSLAGIPATGRVVANGKSLNRVSGHRDAFSTACPGRYLYAKLPEIRTGASALMAAPAPTPTPSPSPAPAPTPAPSPAAAPWAATRYTAYKPVVLRQGSRGTAVVVVQRALKVAADSDFGPRTRAAVVTFQTQQHMTRDGIVNRTVWNRLEIRDYPLIAYRRVTLRQGSRGVAVVVAQRALRVTADGDFGPRTAAAVKVVQASARLARTGVISGWTWVAIENRMRR